MSGDFLGRSAPLTDAVVGKHLFGSPKKMNLGIWIVRRDLPEPFSVTEASRGVNGRRNFTDPQIGGYLRTYANLEMVERLNEPELYTQRYKELDHPLWLIFEAAASAMDQLEGRLISEG
jgi:hypothetical protein